VTDDGQLGLFAVAHEEETRATMDPETSRLAAALPSHVRFGTSSWTYPGWKGIVYEGDTRLPTLIRSGLGAYARHPLFRAVGLDRTHYAPVPDADLASYAAQLPANFQVLSKIWDEVTTFVFPDHPRLGARAGKRNPRFLDASMVTREILPAYASAFAAHAGPFIFEIPRFPSFTAAEHGEFLHALDRLLDHLPTTFSYAFELRTPALLTARYLRILSAHRAAHVLNFWTGMPDLASQMAIPGVRTAPFVVARVMLPPGLRYEDGKAAFAPFDRVVTPQLAMRRDVVTLSARCASEGRTLTVLVGNKAEGCAPLTVRALAQAIVRAQ
jgi:uncharacterized protein YecE (DUF72 family)